MADTANIEKLKDALSAATAQTDAIEELFDTRIAELKIEVARLKKVAGVLSKGDAIDLFHDAARKENMDVKRWMVQTLVAAASDERTDIQINRNLYAKIKKLAHGRSVHESRITKGEDFTMAINNLLENWLV